MTSLLHVDSSASLAGDSVTRRLTASFADVWCRRHGTIGYRYRDLAADPVPLVSHAYTTLGRRWSGTGSSRSRGWPRWPPTRPRNANGR